MATKLSKRVQIKSRELDKLLKCEAKRIQDGLSLCARCTQCPHWAKCQRIRHLSPWQ